jgi:hypothetical protein
LFASNDRHLRLIDQMPTGYRSAFRSQRLPGGYFPGAGGFDRRQTLRRSETIKAARLGAASPVIVTWWRSMSLSEDQLPITSLLAA